MKQQYFWKLIRKLIPNNTSGVVESPIWNTLIPSHYELLDDIDDSDDKENEEDGNDNDDDEEDDDLSPMLVESEEANYMC